MRIIAGQMRGVRLASVGKGDAAAHLRPTTDRVRESLFNVLRAHVDFDGIRVLDLFAGTGALGLEAVSRGAAHATFVDNGRAAQRLLKENIAKLRVEDRVRLIPAPANRLSPAPAPADLVFLDPPYGKSLGIDALKSAHAAGWIMSGTLVVWEENNDQNAEGFETLDHRRYGDTHVSILQAI